MNTMSSGIYVFFIHMLMIFGWSCTNSMPRADGSARTNIRPCACRCCVSASQTLKTSLTCLPSPMMSSPPGKASRSSSCPTCASEPGAQASMNAAQATRQTILKRSVVGFADRIPVIVAEFHAARIIETGDDQPLFARQAGRRSQAEAARHHAIDRPPGTECFDALLFQRVHRALVITLGREYALFPLKEQGHVGA